MDQLTTIERARAGDPDALFSLFQAHEPHLRRMVEIRLEPALRRRVDAADVVQEAWIAAVEKFPGWCERDALPFHVWLRLVTAETLMRVHRRHLGAHKRDALRESSRITDSRPSVSAVALADQFVTSATTPTQAVERDEVRTLVQAAIEELDDIDREILALRQFEGLSNDEAAAELAIDPSAASKRFLRALLRLRPALQKLSPEGDGSGR